MDDGHTLRTRRRRDAGRMILIAVLAVSLAGNALAIGAVARFQSLRHEVLGGAAETALFPRPERRALLAAVRAQSDTLRPELEALVASRVRVVEAGLARPFDRAALDAAMAGFRMAADDMLIALQGVIADTLEARASSPRP